MANQIRNEVRNQPASGDAGAATEHLLCRRIEAHDPPLAIHRHDRIYRGVDDLGQLRLTGPQSKLFGLRRLMALRYRTKSPAYQEQQQDRGDGDECDSLVDTPSEDIVGVNVQQTQNAVGSEDPQRRNQRVDADNAPRAWRTRDRRVQSCRLRCLACRFSWLPLAAESGHGRSISRRPGGNPVPLSAALASRSTTSPLAPGMSAAGVHCPASPAHPQKFRSAAPRVCRRPCTRCSAVWACPETTKGAFRRPSLSTACAHIARRSALFLAQASGLAQRFRAVGALPLEKVVNGPTFSFTFLPPTKVSLS